MGLIREPIGVDLVVDSRELNNKEKQQIREAIAYYKKTGKIMKLAKQKPTKQTVEK